DREAARLEAPELAVVDQVIELLDDRRYFPLVRSTLLKLRGSTPCQVLELDAVCLRIRCDRCRAQVDRDARVSPVFGESRDVRSRRNVDVQHCANLLGVSRAPRSFR